MRLRLFNYKIKPREYQERIARTACKRNTICVMPTGIGKTMIAVLVGCERLEKYPGSKIAMTAPTRPLNKQHQDTFRELTRIDPELIVLVTGRVEPEQRKELYQRARVVVATPQCLLNDLEGGRLSFEDFSFLCIDECHRSVKGYSYVKLARYYMLQASNPLILGLTASPGGCFKRIEEIRKNLFIEAVEVRSEKDEDVKPYIMPVRQEWVYVELPKDFRRVRDLLDECLKENLSWLEQRGLLRSIKASRKDLLGLQDRLIERYRSEPRAPTWHALRRTIEAVKLEHAIELLETQSIPSLLEYMQKLSESEKRIDRDLMRDPRIRTALSLARTLSQTKSHPKLDRLGYIIKDLLRGNARARIMVFANYRSTVDLIKGCLEGQGISSRILIGQALRGGRGLSQREQVSVLEQFNRGDFNVLVASSIGEEGLSIADVNAVIFYDSVASEIRKIQRRGRTGRTAPGKVVFLITKGTRDEAYYWAALHRERKMKGILYRMRKRLRKERSLVQWVKGG